MPTGSATRSAMADDAASASRLQPAAEEHARADPTQHEVRVGHRGLRAAAAEGDRAGIGAGAPGADMEPFLLVDPGDGAAARADLHDVDHRAPYREAGIVAADEIGRAEPELAVADDGAFGGGAAHVEGDQVRNAERLPVGARADAPADGTGFDQRDGLAERAVDRQHAAVRAHHVERALEPAIGEPALQPRRVIRHARPDDRVRHGGAAALVLVPLAGELGSRRYVNARQALAQAFCDRAFVAVVAIGVEERDRHRLHVQPGDRLRQPVDLLRLRLGQHLAPAVHPLVHLEAQRAGDQRRGAAELDVERVGAVAARELERVAESLRRDQRRPGAGALQQRVDDQRRAVLDQQRAGEIDAGLGDAGHHPVDQVAIGGQSLGVDDLAPFHVEGGDVGKGAPGIDGDDQGHGTHGHARMVAGSGGAITGPPEGERALHSQPSSAQADHPRQCHKNSWMVGLRRP